MILTIAFLMQFKLIEYCSLICLDYLTNCDNSQNFKVIGMVLGLVFGFAAILVAYILINSYLKSKKRLL